jgi:hypothetical protein
MNNGAEVNRRLHAIRREIDRRWVWLDHIANGDASVRQVAWQDLGDDGRRESSIRKSYSGRYPIELLQNGHDACDDSGTVGTVRFVLTETALLVANEGVGFERSRVTALTRLGSSSKATRSPAHHQIGYKGIGFTAAFEISDTPQVISNPAAFYFDRTKARQKVVALLGRPEGNEPVPARCFPFHLERAAWDADAEEIERLQTQGAVTVIRLPYRHQISGRRVEADLRASLPAEVLLFMPAVATLEIRSPTFQETWKRRRARAVGRGHVVHLISSTGQRRSWLTIARRATVPTEETAALDDDLWKGVRHLNVAVAIPWGANGPQAGAPPQSLHAYFPTDDRLGRALLIHGDFYLDDSRRHVETRNAPGVISQRVADTAACLVAELAESVASQGRRLLACLAPIGPADGFGEEVGKRIDEKLREARIARPAHGRRPRRPFELMRLASGVNETWERRAVTALTEAGDILRPGDDAGVAGQLLARLGCGPIAPTDLASRFDLARSGLTYDRALNLVERWLSVLSDAAVQSSLAALKERAVVQDRSGQWRRPDDVEERVSNAPELPIKLRRPELLQPSRSTARAFVRRLRVAALNAGTALDRILEAIAAGTFGATDSDRTELLEFMHDLWGDNKGIFGARASRLGAVPVPARTFRGKRRIWRRADATYFSAPWIGSRALEDLYGPLGRAEFLAEEPPDNTMARAAAKDLYAMLGVAPRPRLLPVDASRCAQYWSWRALPPVTKAARCVENRHEYSGVRIEGAVIDRLDDVLELANSRERGVALAHGLLMLEDPYGHDVAIRCDNSEHRGHAARRRAVGYQRWRLEAVAWIPVRGDPSGVEVQLPARAWTDIPRTSDWLVVPRAQLRPEDGRRLALVRAEQPKPEAVVAALTALGDTHPDLSAAPAVVRDSARWLMTRLERVLRRVDERSDVVPPLVAELDSALAWSHSPLINNVPGLPRLAGIALLPSGRWTSLARTYGLRRASDTISAEIQVGPVRHVDRVLPVERRAQLLALLVNGDSNDRQTAARIASIREIGVSFLNIRWSVDGVAAETVEATTYLELRRDSQGRPVGATMYHDARRQRDPFLIGRTLADYLNLPDSENAIVLFLTDPDKMVKGRDIQSNDITEALGMLRQRRAFVSEPEVPVSAEAPPSSGEAPAASTIPSDGGTSDASRSRADSRTGVARLLLDPERVAFGPPQPAKGAREESRASGGRTAGARQRSEHAPPMIPPGSAPTPDEEAERRAVKIVTRYGYEVKGALEVRNVERENKGWDLEFHFADRVWQPVEVKGSLGHGPFVITPNEWSASQRHRNYVLYHVVGIANPATARLRCFTGLGARLHESHVKSMSWVVTGWRELGPEEIPLDDTEL